jgi:hypothetical protein
MKTYEINYTYNGHDAYTHVEADTMIKALKQFADLDGGTEAEVYCVTELKNKAA